MLIDEKKHSHKKTNNQTTNNSYQAFRFLGIGPGSRSVSASAIIKPLAYR